jgi:hypothetical protein
MREIHGEASRWWLSNILGKFPGQETVRFIPAAWLDACTTEGVTTDRLWVDYPGGSTGGKIRNSKHEIRNKSEARSSKFKTSVSHFLASGRPSIIHPRQSRPGDREGSKPRPRPSLRVPPGRTRRRRSGGARDKNSMLIRAFLSSVTSRKASRAKARDPLRSRLADELKKAGTDCRFQEFLIEQGVNTLVKLSGVIRDECTIVIHVIGNDPGLVPPRAVVGEFLRSLGEEEVRKRFPPLFENNNWLRLSYTQWEAWLAKFHRDDGLVFFQLAGMQQGEARPNEEGTLPLSWTDHLRLLKPYGGYNEEYANAKDLLIKVQRVLLRKAQTGRFDDALAAKCEYLRDRFGPGAVDRLKVLLNSGLRGILDDRFVLHAWVQIVGAFPEAIGERSIHDLELVDRLAERERPHDLLVLVLASEAWCRAQAMEPQAAMLREWFCQALEALHGGADRGQRPAETLTEATVRGRGSVAIEYLASPVSVRPMIELGWRKGNAAGYEATAEAFVRCGRVRQKAIDRALDTKHVLHSTYALVSEVTRRNRYINLQYQRIDFFLTLDDLERPWEYCHCGANDNVDHALAWPSAIRLHEAVPSGLKAPPERFCRGQVACSFDLAADELLSRIRSSGAFCLAGIDGEGLGRAVRDAANRAWFGLWIRSGVDRPTAEMCLGQLEEAAVADLPRRLHELKQDAPAGSAWRRVGILLDHPAWPRFQFTEDVFGIDEQRTVNDLLGGYEA